MVCCGLAILNIHKSYSLVIFDQHGFLSREEDKKRIFKTENLTNENTLSAIVSY